MKQAFFQAAAVLIRCFGVIAMYSGLVLVAGRSYLPGVLTLVLGVAALGFNGEGRV